MLFKNVRSANIVCGGVHPSSLAPLKTQYFNNVLPIFLFAGALQICERLPRVRRNCFSFSWREGMSYVNCGQLGSCQFQLMSNIPSSITHRCSIAVSYRASFYSSCHG